MLTACTLHAAERAQQRGIPPLITSWLLDYGEEVFDGRGGVIRYFTRRSIRRMEREFGATPLKRLSEYLRCYLVQSNDDGSIITVGKRHPRTRIWKH
jgi:hypothetical protein